jgi:hypothetical protein
LGGDVAVQESQAIRWAALFHVLQESFDYVSVDVAEKFGIGEEFEVFHIEVFLFVVLNGGDKGAGDAGVACGTILLVRQSLL